MSYQCPYCRQFVVPGTSHYCPRLGRTIAMGNIGGPSASTGAASRPKRGRRRRVDPLWPYDTP